MIEGGILPAGGGWYSGKGVGVTGTGVTVGGGGVTLGSAVGTFVDVPVAVGFGSLFLHALSTRLSKSTLVIRM
jgi:hypothetical protein